MQFSNDGLTLWYGTDDAPAPSAVSSEAISLTVGVYPASLNNRVVVHYRVDDDIIRQISAVLIKSDPLLKTQYFQAVWPPTMAGERVEYLPILTSAGRQTPNIQTTNTLPSSFRLIQPQLHPTKMQPEPHSTAVTQQMPQPVQKSVNLDFLCTVKVEMSRPPEIIGETPEGLKVNWFLQQGEVYGPKLNATICPKGGDWMTIRPDGVGIMGVRATLKTQEGALIYATYSGVFDLGERGYQNFLNHQWPGTPQVRSTPRFLTAHAQYQWLNRLQCIGIGEVQMAQLVMIYDLYAL